MRKTGSASLTARILGPDDVAAFRTLRLAALRTDPQAFASEAKDWEGLDDDGWRARMGTVLVAAFDGAKPIGLMGCRRHASSKMAHRADLIMVWVAPTYRGGDAAGHMLRMLIDTAQSLGIRQLELAVSADNARAIAFYDSQGFEKVGRIPGGFCHDGRDIDEIVMVRSLR